MIYIKMFGAERSGVSFIGRTIGDNFFKKDIYCVREFGLPYEIPLLGMGDVKQYPKRIGKPDRYLVRFIRKIIKEGIKLTPVVITKNPYTWYYSIHRYRRLRQIDWDREFEAYNLYYSIFKRILTNYRDYDIYTIGEFLQYEEFIENPEAALDKISHVLRVRRKKKLNISKEMDTGYRFLERDRRFYLSEGPWSLSPTYMKKITDRINWEVMSFFGYSPVYPEDFYDEVIYEDET